MVNHDNWGVYVTAAVPSLDRISEVAVQKDLMQGFTTRIKLAVP